MQLSIIEGRLQTQRLLRMLASNEIPGGSAEYFRVRSKQNWSKTAIHTRNLRTRPSDKDRDLAMLYRAKALFYEKVSDLIEANEVTDESISKAIDDAVNSSYLS